MIKISWPKLFKYCLCVGLNSYLNIAYMPKIN